MLTRLKLSNFRNYAQLDLKLGDGASVILTGANGSGKTNILEAVSMLAPGRGLRGARLSEMDTCHPERAQRAEGSHPSVNGKDPSTTGVPPFAQDDRKPWAIYAELANGVTLGTGRDAEADSDKRIIKVNGTAVRGQSALAEHIAILSLTPAMDQTFADGPSSRRDFLDRLTGIFHADHTRHHAIYNHAKSERLKLLARYASDTAWLTTLERRMAEHGIAIAAARLETISLLSTQYSTLNTFPKALLSITGIESSLQTMSALEAEDALTREFAASRLQDASSGQTSCGPGRSDFRVIHSIKSMPAELCSTGEQKALLLSITLAAAHARRRWKGTAPILLLDEVVAHLDPTKRAELFTEIAALDTQCWLTGTDPGFFTDFQGNFQRFSVADGVVKG